MNQISDEIKKLARDNVIVYRALQCMKAGEANYQTALEALVLTLAKQNEALYKQNLELLQNKPVQYVIEGVSVKTLALQLNCEMHERRPPLSQDVELFFKNRDVIDAANREINEMYKE